MIRLATHNDIDAILAIGEATLAESPSYPVEFSDKKARYMVRRAISDRTMDCFVAEVNGQVVGFLIALWEEHFFSKDAYATDMAFCVSPKHGDQAVWLLRRFIRWASQFPKVKTLMLGVSSGHTDAARIGQLYERHGFQAIGGLYSKSV
ncbi:GNAT family N-acetyltransferase [Paraferrimonas sedimenticola]|uniref:N-acetyltransferase domain-containing protein n=1 Tax=Paraferrimonas sedimenticola TaxID=375674 RepID=A0AA37W0D7_9GAMM|nr:GNAT family N-acetyltransferase [Paraferrimonas sedimenticola]GLP95278.1 hypothetical protein GCM10007895_05840 [Paraferrimonas sedimenticola]